VLACVGDEGGFGDYLVRGQATVALSVLGLVGIPTNWRREKRAMDTGLALA